MLPAERGTVVKVLKINTMMILLAVNAVVLVGKLKFWKINLIGVRKSTICVVSEVPLSPPARIDVKP